MQQFRLVILDDYDNVISVEYESPIFEGESEFDKDISKAQFEHLLSIEYNLLDYENIPILEYQPSEEPKTMLQEHMNLLP